MLAPHFSPELFTFLRDLATHNDRDWFERHKERYELHVKEAAFGFISDFGPRLEAISPYFRAIPRAVRGSLFRIHRDTRFSHDKRPYKTHTGIRFPHSIRGEVHAPGFYLHLQPEACFVGVGIWHPDAPTLQRIREALVEDPDGWCAARDDGRFRRSFQLGGESLKRAPRGFDPDHPLIEDLKRKDFIASRRLSDEEVTAPGFLDRFADDCAAGAPFVRHLCTALGLPF